MKSGKSMLAEVSGNIKDLRHHGGMHLRFQTAAGNEKRIV